MYRRGTVNCLQSFTFLQNIFCINRYYLFSNNCTKISSVIIFLASISSTVGAFVYDFIFLRIELNFTKQFLYFISLFELVYLVLDAKKRNTFDAIDRLDVKCGVDDYFYKRFKVLVRRLTIQTIITVMMNMVAVIIQKADLSLILLFGFATSAHDAEMDLIRLLIEGFNIRLMRLKNASPSVGSRIYRHILMTASHLGAEFHSRMLLMLSVTLTKTVVYTVFAILFDKDSYLEVGLLAWHQCRSLYSLWRLSLAANNTKSTCRNLEFHLAKRLVMDASTSKVKNRKQYDIIRRLYKSLVQEKPQYMNGSVESIDLNIPLNIFDVSVNYLLVIIQIYVAFK